MKTPQSASLDLAAESSGGTVQRASCPVQRGVAGTPPVGADEVGIVAITQKAPVRPPRRFLRTFKPRFARLVEAGKKFQTVRPIPKREQDMPRAGDLFDAREWTGLPRRSKMRKLLSAPAPISSVKPITLGSPDGRLLYIVVDGFQLDGELTENFARADGFADAAEMAAWFRAKHELPFTGIVIDWLPF